MIVAIDVGGSSVKSGLVGPHGPIGRLHVTPLVHTAPADALVDRLAAAVRTAARDTLGAEAPLRVAAAVPDPFDHAAGVSLMRHKFAAVHGRPLGPLVTAALARPAELRWCNDAAAAVTGEAVAGAARQHRRVLGVTLGTGLGAAFVVDGTPVPMIGELVVGELWQTVLADGRTADTAYCARSLLATLDHDPGGGGRRFGDGLGALLAPLVDAAHADVVVVGGGGARSYDEFAPALAGRVPVPVVRGSLGEWAGLIGAAHLCFPG